jgi:hypothetical protein
MQRFIRGVAALVLLWGGAGQAAADGGNVLPPTASPSGYTLADMAEELAFFDTSGNNLAYYPDTPFQILYVDPAVENTFTVKTGTLFFVPLFSLDDSPPIIGAFPANAADAEGYVFGDTQIGADEVEIEVDGLVTSIGPEYVAGPVVTPALPDGGGTHLIQVGAFLTPLSKGTHTVTIRGTFDGDAVVASLGSAISFEFTYTVIVND